MIIHSGPVYGGTDFLLKKILPQFGVTLIGFLSEGGSKAMEEAVESARGKGPIAALYIETPANPTNGMVDLERARKIVSSLHGPDGKQAGYHSRQYNVGTDLSGPVGTWCRSGRHVAY